MFVSAAVNAVVGILLLRAGKKTGSIALKADAWHCLTDVYTSAGVMVALAVVWAARFLLPGINLSWVGIGLIPSSRARFELKPGKKRANALLKGAKHHYLTLKK